MWWYNGNTVSDVTTHTAMLSYTGNYCHKQEAIWCHVRVIISGGVSNDKLRSLTSVDGNR